MFQSPKRESYASLEKKTYKNYLAMKITTINHLSPNTVILENLSDFIKYLDKIINKEGERTER